MPSWGAPEYENRIWLQCRMTEGEQKTWNVVIKYSGIIASAHTGRPFFYLFLLLVMIFIAVCIRIQKIHQICPLKSLILCEVVEWRTAVCILSEIDCFNWKKKKSLEIVLKWKMYAIASISSAWCPSKKKDYSCLLWHFIKYCVLIQVTWGILQNLLFCFPLHLFEL